MGEIMPGKLKYDTYHKEFTGAIQHAYAVVKKQGYKIDKDSQWNDITTGPKKPGKGKTNEYHLKLKGTKKGLHIQVYNTGPKYELNMYIEETDMTDLNKFITLLEAYDCDCDDGECGDECDCEKPEFDEKVMSISTRKKMGRAQKKAQKKGSTKSKKKRNKEKAGMSDDQAIAKAKTKCRNMFLKKFNKGEAPKTPAEKMAASKKMNKVITPKKLAGCAKKQKKNVKKDHKLAAQAIKKAKAEKN
jgi:hypothetical protein